MAKNTATKKTGDELVQELFDKVQSKKAALAQANKPCWNTSGSFGYSPSNPSGDINIKTLNDKRKIVDMLAFLMDRARAHSEAASALGVTAAFSWQGFTLNEWKSDFQTRVDQLMYTEKKKELDQLEARLDAILSPEMKRTMELNTIAALVNA